MQHAPRGERRPLERLADLFHNVFCHADFTSSDVAATLYLAAMLQRLDRRSRISSLLHSGAHMLFLLQPKMYKGQQYMGQTRKRTIS